MNPSTTDFNQRSIIECSRRGGARLTIEKCRLANFEFCTLYCGIQNDENRFNRLKNQLELSVSLIEIKDMASLEDENSTEIIKKDVEKDAPTTFKKYVCGKNLAKNK